MVRTIIRIAPRLPIGACRTVAHALFRGRRQPRGGIEHTELRETMAGRAASTAAHIHRAFSERQTETDTRGIGREQDLAAPTSHQEPATAGRHTSRTTTSGRRSPDRSNIDRSSMRGRHMVQVFTADPQMATGAGQARPTAVRCGTSARRLRVLGTTISGSGLLAARRATALRRLRASSRTPEASTSEAATLRKIPAAAKASVTRTQAEAVISAATATPAANTAAELRAF